MCHQLCQLHSVCGHVTKREIPCDVTASSLKKTRPNPWPTAIDTGSKVKDAFITWCLKSLKPVTNKAHPLRSTCRPPLTLLHEVEYGFCPKCREYYDKYAANVFRGDGVTKIIGMEMGSGGSTDKLEKVKDLRRRTLEWAEEGDSAREKAKIERNVDMEKAEENKREKERLKQEKLQQEMLKQERLKEKNIKREKRLEAERFEQERQARKERRLEIRKWLEDKDSIEDDLKKVEKEKKKQRSGKEKVKVEIENIQGRTLIEYEHGKSEMEVRVRMSSRPQPASRGLHLGASHHHEGVSGNDEKLDEKPKVYRSRGVSELVKFYESRSNETKTKKEGVRSALSESPVEKKLPQNCQKDTLGVTEKPAQNQATAKCVNQRPEVQKAVKTNTSAPGLQQQPQPVGPKALESQHRPSLLMSKPKSSTFRPPPGTPQPQPPTDGKAKASTPVDEPPAIALKCCSQLPANQEDSSHAVNTENSEKKLSPTSQDMKEERSTSEKNDSERPPPIRRSGTATPKSANTVPVHQDSNKKPSASKRDDEMETSQIGKKEGHQQTQSCRTAPARSNKTPGFSTQAEGGGEPPVILSKQEPLQPKPLPSKPTKPEASKPDPVRETKPQRTPYATCSSSENNKSSTPPIDPAPGNTSFNPSIGSMTVECDPTEQMGSNDSISSMAVNCDPTDSKVSNPSIDSMAVECDPADSRLSITPVGSMVVEHDSTDSTLSNVSIGSMVVECDSLESIHSIVSNGSMVVEYEPTEGTVSNPSIDSMKAELDSIEQSVLWEDIRRHLGCDDGSILAHPSYCMCAKCIRAR
ncbi:hypothetical protein NCU08532 [Neurospora crassa OR74A]|uniref:Uncharacterized protein n=1 Tax=Neurospora crassa (strain ATCC 24698 / 74-OR23-1A / CBS 708.71 / DSM 1257 / FGSC 987) TaxID=367110 RepID=Q7SBL8_NEUCR|nr:hypothetical protein NCU08532 [Neurospora crassa OR74A]EAA33778.1 hypothetical protein NCU08532 [Neurospora crassa OR74A]|eukprot:XP_963014.1 hypothetical protein NCU08532 [Neurospora crassa OR74A]